MTNMINIVARSAALGTALGVLFTGAILYGTHDDSQGAPAHHATVVTATDHTDGPDDRWP
jgi:hypothetical protein